MAQELIDAIPVKNDSPPPVYGFQTISLLKQFVDKLKEHENKLYKPKIILELKSEWLGRDIDHDLIKQGMDFCVIIATKKYKYNTKQENFTYKPNGHYYGDDDDYKTSTTFTIEIQL